MKLESPISAQELAQNFKCELIGDSSIMAFGINELNVINENEIAFVDHPKYYDKTLASSASIIIINKKVECPDKKALLFHEDPFSVFVHILKQYKPFLTSHKSISDTAQIGENTHIQPNCFIGNNVIIGKNCTIHANVTLQNDTIIGDNVVIQSNTVIGGDGFYYKIRENSMDKFHSIGRVVIQDFVEIGSGCTIDKGVTDETVIGEHTKIDNLVHIGHDTKIGKRCLIASQTGISGAVKIEDHVTIWGQVGVSSKVVIGEKAEVLGQSGVTKSIEGGKKYFGTPAMETREIYTQMAALRALPEWLKKK